MSATGARDRRMSEEWEASRSCRNESRSEILRRRPARVQHHETVAPALRGAYYCRDADATICNCKQMTPKDRFMFVGFTISRRRMLGYSAGAATLLGIQ